MRRKLTKKVEFVFNKMHGHTGLVQKETEEVFDPHWNTLMLFHDVFEHNFEGIDKHFKGDYSLNVGGEIAAMGALSYYYDYLGFSYRLETGIRSMSNSDNMIVQTILHYFNEAVDNGYCPFGNQLLSNVPDQAPIEDENVEYLIQKLWNAAKKRAVPAISSGMMPDERAHTLKFKASITKRKIANLMRYGWRMAEKTVPNSHNLNISMLYEFWEHWDAFFRMYPSAEELSCRFKGLTVSLFVDTEGYSSWKYVLHSADPYSFKDVKFDWEKNDYSRVFDMDDTIVNVEYA